MKTVGVRLPLWFMGKTHKASEHHLFMVKIRVGANDLRPLPTVTLKLPNTSDHIQGA